jgi:hypothetical protein
LTRRTQISPAQNADPWSASLCGHREVVTDRAYRKRGYGARVLRALIDRCWALDCYKIMLSSGANRAEVHSFYECARLRSYGQAGLRDDAAHGRPVGDHSLRLFALRGSRCARISRLDAICCSHPTPSALRVSLYRLVELGGIVEGLCAGECRRTEQEAFLTGLHREAHVLTAAAARA